MTPALRSNSKSELMGVNCFDLRYVMCVIIEKKHNHYSSRYALCQPPVTPLMAKGKTDIKMSKK